MAIDIEKAIAAAVAERGEMAGRIIGERRVLGLILRSRSMTDFERFFEYFGKRDRGVYLDLEKCPALFGPWWMSHLEERHLLWFYDHLLMDFGTLKLLEKFVADDRIPLARRAFFYHAAFGARAHVLLRFGSALLPPFWWDNRSAWREYSCFVKNDDPDAFIRRYGTASRSRFDISDALAAGMKKDSVAVVEMTRQLDNRRLSDSMMRKLIEFDSGSCFAYALEHHTEQVFKLRSPEEWLFTVCRCAKDDFAVAAAGELERQFPGIAARARDPWGNTALWSTFFNAHPTGKLQMALLNVGCDPEARNASGLSYRLLKDHDPEKLRKALKSA